MNPRSQSRRHPSRRHTGGSHPRCPLCGGEYREVDGCDPNARPTVHVWGAEPWWHDGNFWPVESLHDLGYEDDEIPQPMERCPDCTAALGFPHHDGCCKAHCWSCEDQAIACPHSAPLGSEDPHGNGEAT